MAAAIGTLPFLATLWLLIVLGARVLEESGAKIAAALKGQSMHRPVCSSRTIRIRMRQPEPPRRVQPKLRAAA